MMALAAGTRIGPYEIQSAIGAGWAGRRCAAEVKRNSFQLSVVSSQFGAGGRQSTKILKTEN